VCILTLYLPILPCGTTQSLEEWQGFSLILGSDVIYSWTVVEPLFATVNAFLQSKQQQKIDTAECKACFLMSQSFGYDEQTEQAIDSACAVHGLLRVIIGDALGHDAGTKLQVFTRSSGSGVD
jgi:hypothetical protein